MLASLPGKGAATPATGIHFTHHDWEVACDNTRTCRMAGYHNEGGGNNDDDDDGEADAGKSIPMSVLLTRKAGPREPVVAALQVTNPDDQADEAWLTKRTLIMKINAQPIGTLVLSADKWTFTLTPEQTAHLLAALTKRSKIEWMDGKHTWKLSGQGASAVMLKMDEFQGRIGTPGALLRKGSKDENSVRLPLPAPVIQAVKVWSDEGFRLSATRLKTLRAAVSASMKQCSDIETDSPQAKMHVHRLSATKLLASTLCWRGAYNEGSAYWVVNANPPYAPQLVTHDASDYANGKITASHKGRGASDCWSVNEWVWDGKRFAHASQETSGQCKSIMPGGAWSLPVLVTTVRPAPASRP